MRRRRRGLTLAMAAAVLPVLACDRAAPDGVREGAPVAGEEEDALAGLVEAERAFARMAEQEGLDAAFQRYLAPEGILFRPGPVTAGAWLPANPFPLASLRWVPTGAALASSGDLGYTTGPYVATDDAGSESYGHYVSIWAAEGGGAFHVVLDTGTPGPSTGPLPESPEVADTFEAAPAPAGGATPEPGLDALEALMGIDRGYAVAQATQGTLAALGTHAARSVRIQRPGTLPTVGIEGFETDPGGAAERVSTSPIGGRVSASGTLGYVYGSVASNGEADAGNYVRIWRRDPGAPWMLALELVDILPD